MDDFIIAIDGTAASGKGTLAKQLSEYYGLAYLDTGLTYRAVAQAVLQKKAELTDKKAILAAANLLDLHKLDGNLLSTQEIGDAASKIAIHPELREILVQKQRQFAKHNKKAVLDGRDIATIVCPQAQVKLYIDADLDLRAQRRFAQLKNTPRQTDLQKIRQDLQNRDERDKTRKVGALIKAPDAILIDNSQLNVVQSFQRAKEIIDPIINACRAARKDIYRKN
ncbi:MAG: (d)CMP kinase [Alphaproteobacteria bacterium]|nr:(d)CMP kinase [Alphaproteobacteria bacterium]